MPIRLRDQSVYLGRAASTLADFAPNFDGSFVGVGTFTGVLARQLQPFTGALVGQYQAISLKTGTIGVTLQNASAAIVGATADTVAPPAPSAPTIDAFTSTSITIRFPTSAAPDHASWNVWRSPEGNFWTQIATGITAATYTNSGLTAETTYYYALVDVDTSANASALGASVSQTTAAAGAGVGHGLTPTHYVELSANGGNPTGVQNGAAYSAATNPNTPCTLRCALDNAQPGHVIQVGPGQYLGPPADSQQAASWRCANSGTSGSRITFVATYPAAYNTNNPSLFTEIGQQVAGRGTTPTLGQDGVGAYRSYITFDGFYIDQNGAAPSHPNGTCIAYSPSGTNSDIQYRRMLFDAYWPNSNTNYNCIQIRGTSRTKILDCYFRGSSQANLSHNAAVTTLYGGQDVEIAYNTYENVNCGIFIKGSNAGQGNYGDIHHNKFIGLTGSTVEIAETYGQTGQTNIYQNLAYGFDSGGQTRDGFVFDNEAGSTLLEKVSIYNNTIVSKEMLAGGLIVLEGGNIDGTNCVVRDNIFAYVAPLTQVLANATASTPTIIGRFDVWNYNMYYDNGSTPNYAFNGNDNMTFAQWKSATGVDANSTEDNPAFVDSANDDYRLSGGSPARNASSTGQEIGCYITGSEEIGVRANPTY